MPTSKKGVLVSHSAYNLNSGTQVYTTSSFISSGVLPLQIFPGVNITTPADAGNVDIWNYQTYLMQINAALNTAFAALVGTGYEPTKAPTVVYNPTSKLFSLLCQGVYLNQVAGLPKYTVAFNTALYNQFLFPLLMEAPGILAVDSNWSYINIQDMEYNTSSETPPLWVSAYQECSTIAKFYDLVRILVATSKIPVNGDSEGVNSSVSLLTDIVPDTSVFSPGGLIVYNPSILRDYNLETSVPLRDIDIQFFYGTKDGSIYKVNLPPGEYASIKLEFEQVIE